MERYQVVLCAWQNGLRSVLLTPGEGANEDRWQLPGFFPETAAHNIDLPVANAAIGERFGLREVRTRYAVRLPNDGSPLNVYVAEPMGERVALPDDGSRWFSMEELSSLHFTAPIQGEVVLVWLREIGGDPRTLLPWWREGWFAQSERRLDGCLARRKSARLHPVEQLRSAYTAALWRLDTDDGTLYWKVVAPPFQREARLTHALSRLHPENLPRLLNADEIEKAGTNASEMLTADVGGESVGSHTALSTWTEIVHRYARIQSESVGRVELLLREGCADLRVGTVRDRIAQFPARLQSALKGAPAGLTEAEWTRLESLVPRIYNGLGRLAGCGLPDCLEHGDLHVGNLRWDAAKKCPVFLDWSHACVTFPFYGYGTLALDDDWFGTDAKAASARVEWAYLSPWAAYAGPDALSEAFVMWKPLRHLFIAERQIEIIAAFQTLWADGNRGAGAPRGDALRQMQWWLRDAARQLLTAHKEFH